MPIEFDFEGARKSGATDKDISGYFKEKYSIDFDIEGAKKNGANDTDILDYLNTKYSEPVKKKEPAIGLGYEKPSEALRMGVLPKQEKLSQSPLKTAVTTTPSVSTKSALQGIKGTSTPPTGVTKIKEDVLSSDGMPPDFQKPQPRLSAEEQQTSESAATKGYVGQETEGTQLDLILANQKVQNLPLEQQMTSKEMTEQLDLLMPSTQGVEANQAFDAIFKKEGRENELANVNETEFKKFLSATGVADKYNKARMEYDLSDKERYALIQKFNQSIAGKSVQDLNIVKARLNSNPAFQEYQDLKDQAQVLQDQWGAMGIDEQSAQIKSPEEIAQYNELIAQYNDLNQQADAIARESGITKDLQDFESFGSNYFSALLRSRSSIDDFPNILKEKQLQDKADAEYEDRRARFKKGDLSVLPTSAMYVGASAVNALNRNFYNSLASLIDNFGKLNDNTYSLGDWASKGLTELADNAIITPHKEFSKSGYNIDGYIVTKDKSGAISVFDKDFTPVQVDPNLAKKFNEEYDKKESTGAEKETMYDFFSLAPQLADQFVTMYSLVGGGRLAQVGLQSLTKRAISQNTGMTAASYLMTYEDYKKTGIENGLSDTDAHLFASISAMTTSLLEGISPNENLIPKGQAAKALEAFTASVGAPIKTRMNAVAKALVVEPSKEIIQEITQIGGDILTETGANAVLGKDVFDAATDMDEIRNTAVLTFGTTALAQLPTSGMFDTKNKKEWWQWASKDVDKLMAQVQEDVKNGLYTEEKAQIIVEKAKGWAATQGKIPAGTEDVKRAQITPLLMEKVELLETSKDLDKVFQDKINKRIDAIDKEIVGIMNKPVSEFTTEVKETTTEETDGEGTIEGAISTGTDVAEEGLGVANEPSGEGITGEGVQTEKVLKPSQDQILSDVQSNNVVTFEYKSENEIPDSLKDKVSSVITINGKKVYRVTLSKSEADFLLQEGKQQAEAIDSEREYLEKDILSEEQYIAERKNKKSKFRKVLDKLSGVTYDKYLKAQQNRLSLLNENPLAYFEKELADEKKWQEKNPEDANENLINYLTEVVDNFKSREQAEAVPQTPLEEQQVPEVVSEKVTEVTVPAIEVTPTAEAKTTTKPVAERIADLRAAEKAEYDAMANPNDAVEREKIYNKYNKLITPLLEEQKATEAAKLEPVKEAAKPTKSERKAIAEAKIDDLAAKAKEFLRNKNLPEGTKVSGVSQNKVIDILASTVKALVNSGIEISEAIKQVREYFEQDFDTSGIKDYEIAQKIARDELTDVAKDNGFSSYRQAVFAVNNYVREVGKEDVITKEEIEKAKEAKDKETEAPKKGYTSKKKKAQEGEKESVEDKTGTRAFAAKAMDRAGVPISEIPVNLRNYTTTNVEEQTKIAEEFIAKYGIDNTIQLLKQKDASIDPRNKPVLASVLLNALYAEQGKTTDAAILKKIANDVYDVIDATLTAATNAAQFMSFMREFYNSNPYNFVAQVTRLIEKNINQPIETKISDAVVEINEENKKAAGKAASNVVKNIVSPKATAAREQYNKSKANLKSIWNKGLNVGISANQYENAKNDVQFVKALSVMAKDFVVYQSVQFSEFLKEVATELGLKESDIDQDHLKGIFEKAKSEKITSGIKVGLKELELKLKDLIEEHYTSAETIEDKLVDKLVKQFGLSEKDAKEVEKAVRYEIKVLTAKQKIKALKAAGIKDKTYINELLVLSEAGLLDTQSIIEEFGKKLGMKELTKEEMDKLVALAQAVADSKEDRIKARNVQKFEDYKFVLSKQYKISDFLVSNYLTNIFGSLGANLKNIVGNVSETMLLTSELMGNALISGNPKEMLAAARALADGTARGFDFTKEVLAKGTASYKELSQIRPRGMWELIMDREVNLTRTERTLQFLFKIPYLGPASLAERRFWNRALLSMDSLSGTTNNELGSLLAATKEANKQGLKGKERANFIAEQMANSPEAISEAKAYAISLGYKEGTKAFRMAYKNYLVSKRPEAIKKAAAEYSGRATLTQEPPVHTLTGFVADTINNAISKNQKLKFIFPVVNTFANLIIKNIERSPFEFFSLGLDVVRAGTDAKVKEALTQEEIARRIKTATVWTAIAVLLFMAAGGMEDEDEEGFEIYGSGTGNKQIDAIRRATGWKPNSIRFGKDGGYWSFEFLPFGFLLSMVGNMRDYFKYNDETGLAVKKAQSKRLFGKTYDSLTETEKMKLESELMTGKYNYSELKKKELANLSWNVVKTPATYTAQLFKSLGDVIGVLSSQSGFQNIKSILGNIGRGVASPRYMGEVRDITDNKLYDSKDFFNMLGSNVPFVTLGNVRLDAFGRDVEKYKKESILSGVKYAFQRGFYNPSKGTPLDQFLWENKIGIGIPDDTATLALPEDAYREFIVTRGKILMDYLTKALEDKSLTERKSISGKIIELTPDEIVKRINKYVTKATEEARKDIDKKLGRNNKIE